MLVTGLVSLYPDDKVEAMFYGVTFSVSKPFFRMYVKAVSINPPEQPMSVASQSTSCCSLRDTSSPEYRKFTPSTAPEGSQRHSFTPDRSRPERAN